MPTAKSVKKAASTPKVAPKKPSDADAAATKTRPGAKSANAGKPATTTKTASTGGATKKKTAAAAKAPAKTATTARSTSKNDAGHKNDATHPAEKVDNKAAKADAKAEVKPDTQVKGGADKKDIAAKVPTKHSGGDKVATKNDHKDAEGKKTATVQKPVFDDKFLEEQRALLIAEREKYLRSAQILKADADSLVYEREPGDVQFDEESGEGDTLAVERDFELALSAQARQQVEEIDAALTRIAEGTYGICRVSGQPIPKERLRAIPWATERVEYKVGGLGRR